MKRIMPFLLLFCVIAVMSCEKSSNPETELPEVVRNTTGHEQWETPVDYSNVANWLNISAITKDVDLVYFYPTCYTQSSSSDLDLSSIDNAGMRSQAASRFAEQATAFAEDCNIFAPFYKQVSATYGLTLSLTKTMRL